METMEIERSSPAPLPLTHRIGSDGEATGTVTPVPEGEGVGDSNPDNAFPPADDAVPASSEGGDGASGAAELPDLPSLPDDLDFDDDVSRPTAATSSARDELDLMPLPTYFDPDAPVPTWKAEPLPEDDELALRPREEPAPEPESEVAAEEVQDEVTVEEQAGEQVDEQHVDGDDPHQLFHLLQGLHDGGGEEAYPAPEETAVEEEAPEAHAEQPIPNAVDGTAMAVDEPEPPRSPSPFASPLTPIPDLPSELPSDSEVPSLPQLPAAALAPELKTAPPAESSAAASERARSRSFGSGSPAEPRKRKGKSPAHTSDEQDNEDEGEKRAKYQRRKGLDGKPIRVKPRKRIDAQLGIKRHGDKPPEKVAPRAKTLTDQKIVDLLIGKDRDVQHAPCIRPRYGVWGKCTQCVSKIGGDSCRFRDYRVFPLNPKNAEITGPGTFENTTLKEAITPQPNNFNVRLTEEHVKRTEKTVAPLLVDLISREMRHVVKNDALHRPIDTAKHRSVCDFCASTIFAGFWFCEKCGRDYCIECERFFSDTQERMSESPWPVPAPARPRLHRCTRGDDQLPLGSGAGRTTKPMHFRPNLRAASRFTADELRRNFAALVNYVLEPGASDMDVGARVASLGLGDDEGELADAVRDFLHTTTPAQPSKRPLISDADVAELYDASRHLAHPPDPTDVPPLPFMYIDADRLDDVFDTLWARGEPLVAHNIGKRLKPGWTPDNFLRRFGPEPCYVVDCQADKSLLSSVGAFFLLFKELGGETQAPAKAGANGAPPAASIAADAPAAERAPQGATTPAPDNMDVDPSPLAAEEESKLQGELEASRQPADGEVPESSAQAATEDANGREPRVGTVDGPAPEHARGTEASLDEAQLPAPHRSSAPAEAAQKSETNGNVSRPNGGAQDSPADGKVGAPDGTAIPPRNETPSAAPAGALPEASTAAPPVSVPTPPAATASPAPAATTGSPVPPTALAAPTAAPPGASSAADAAQQHSPPTSDAGRTTSQPPPSRNGTPGATSMVELIARLAPGYPKLKNANKIWKLKDWPATDDFASAYPDLYQDFAQALPAPDFTRRIGALNLYAHFPDGPTKPDIGPKMYNAFAGLEGPGGFGSTRLHMDVADAVNVMLYATKLPDGSPGCAVWDLFRAEDADKIRAFLRNKFPTARMTDPIHSQLFYLSSDLRSELHAEYGVSSFRVYQHPGQAVFIPAGCAHQVCNLAPCMKIALDFVSPHNVRRCQQLMQDFRKENYARVWKDDVLQLYNVMWYAWTNVRGIRDRWKEAEARREQELQQQAASPRPHQLGPAMSSVRDEAPLAPPVRAGSEANGAGQSRDATPAKDVPVTANGDGEGKGDAPPTSPTETRRAALVQRLMDAAIARPLTPTLVPPAEGKGAKGGAGGTPRARRGDTATPQPSAPSTTSTAPEFRYSDAIRGGLVPAELAMGVLRSDLGNPSAPSAAP